MKKSSGVKGGGAFHTLELPRPPSFQKHVPQPVPSAEDQNLLFQLLDAIIPSRRDGLSCTTINIFLPLLPPRIGHHRALDTAVMCLLDRLTTLGDRENPGAARKYANALESLRKCLSDETENQSAETMCATLILHHYEVLRFETGWLPNYLAHAGGAAAIVKARGPSSFRSEFDRAILLAQHCSIVTISMFDASDCFLCDDEWNTVIEESLPSCDGSTVAASCQKSWHRIAQFIGSLTPRMRQFLIINNYEGYSDTSSSYRLAQDADSKLEAFKYLFETRAFKDGTIAEIPWSKETTSKPPPHPQCRFNANECCLHHQKILSFSSLWASHLCGQHVL